MRRSAAAWFFLLAVAITACGPSSISSAVEEGELIEFPGVEALAETFNADTGIPRLVLSLSPT